MTPQFQRYKFGNDEGVVGDCHRTCIAMILDIDRDFVPHFMQDVPYNDDPLSEASANAQDAEHAWLAQRGLAPVYMAFPGDLDLDTLVQQCARLGRGVAMILGCTSIADVGHSVVIYEGKIYNPNGQRGGIKGPMRDGMWWITILAHLTKPLQEAPAPASVETQEAD